MMIWTAAALLFAGTITGVQGSAPSIAVGTSATFTVAGSNPCGAVNIDYGDGTAITYAITGLPVTQSHQFDKAGSFTVIARGMGNCDGEARTSIVVTAPTPPPPPAPAPRPAAEVTALTFTPPQGIVREPVSFNIAGRGRCALVVDYGDGNQQSFETELPRRLSHTYAVADVYTVIVGPVAPCVGKFTEKLEVVPRGGARITSLGIEPRPGRAREAVTFTIDGVGTCTYSLDFGDGNTEERTKRLPDRVTHVYPAVGDYPILLRAGSGCSGAFERNLPVR